MGIRNIHIILIAASTILAVLFGIWGITHDYSALGYGSLLIAIALTIYGINFVKKPKV